MMCLKTLAGLSLALLAVVFILAAPCLAQEPPEEPQSPPQEAPAEEAARPAADEQELKVTATICTDVQGREPVGAGLAFPATVEKLFCHTLVSGAQEPITIVHAWYRGDQKWAEVSLEVKSSPWRTWSSKRIMESWTGAWRVDILDGTGEILATVSFQVQ